MGCNNSKEISEGEHKAKAENEQKCGNEENNASKGDGDLEKSSSAKTVTLKSNPSNDSQNSKDCQDNNNASLLEDYVAEGIDKRDLEEAATKIQAAFRGHRFRNRTKRSEIVEKEDETNTTSSLGIDLKDPELAEAATRIQATFRGHLTRKQKMEDNKSDSKQDQKTPVDNGEEEIDIDLTDPDVQKAAVKIQATFKGHLVRKDNQKPPNSTNK